MNRLHSFFAVLSIAFTLTACGDAKQDKDPGSENPNLSTYSESEQLADLKELNAAEKDLENVGLRIKTEFETKNGLTTTTYSWDLKFMEEFFKKYPNTANSEMVPPLEAYVKVGRAYLQKYSRPFRLKKTNGEIETAKLFDSTREEIESKVSLAEKAVSVISKKPNP